jgi:quinate dehydrogenase
MSSKPEMSLQNGIGVLFGDPIKHSFSPFLHQTVLDALGQGWDFSLFESKDIEAFLEILRDPRCYGLIHLHVILGVN